MNFDNFEEVPSDLGQLFLEEYISKHPEEIELAQKVNFLNPMTWFTRKAQAAIQEADRGGGSGFSNNTLSGKLLERRRQFAEAQNKLR